MIESTVPNQTLQACYSPKSSPYLWTLRVVAIPNKGLQHRALPQFFTDSGKDGGVSNAKLNPWKGRSLLFDGLLFLSDA